MTDGEVPVNTQSEVADAFPVLDPIKAVLVEVPETVPEREPPMKHVVIPEAVVPVMFEESDPAIAELLTNPAAKLEIALEREPTSAHSDKSPPFALRVQEPHAAIRDRRRDLEDTANAGDERLARTFVFKIVPVFAVKFEVVELINPE